MLETLCRHSPEGLLIQQLATGEEFGADIYVDRFSKKAVSIFTKRKVRMRAGETEKTEGRVGARGGRRAKSRVGARGGEGVQGLRKRSHDEGKAGVRTGRTGGRECGPLRAVDGRARTADKRGRAAARRAQKARPCFAKRPGGRAQK